MDQAIDPATLRLAAGLFGVLFTIITGLLIYFIKKVDKNKDERIDSIEKKHKSQQIKISKLEKTVPQYDKIIDLCKDVHHIDSRVTKLESMQLGKKEIVRTIDDAVDNAVARWENKMLKEGIIQPKRRSND